MNIDVQGPRRMIQLLDAEGNIRFAISESVVTGWLVILAVLAVCLILTHRKFLRARSNALRNI